MMNNNNFLIHDDGQFDGKNSKVSFPEPIDFKTDYTIEVWFRTDYASPAGGVLFAAVAPSIKGGKDHGILLEVESNGKLRYLHRGAISNVGGTNLYSHTPVTDNQFYHLAAVRDQAKNSMKLYLNGSLEDEKHTTEPGFAGLDAILGWLKPGLRARMYKGEIQEVRIWNKVRDVTTAEKIDGSENELVGWYRSKLPNNTFQIKMEERKTGASQGSNRVAKKWGDPLLFVKKGDDISIKYIKGKANYSGYNKSSEVGPEGKGRANHKFLSPSHDALSMIGKIGEGEVFQPFRGPGSTQKNSTASHTAKTSGALYFTINDIDTTFDDNTGEWEIEVTIK